MSERLQPERDVRILLAQLADLRDELAALAAARLALQQENEQLKAFLRSHGECHNENCGDDPLLSRVERRAYIVAHENICTCGAEEIYDLVTRESRSPDGDGLPMEKGLEEGRDENRVSVAETGDLSTATGQRTSALGVAGGFAVHRKPAAGSEPADSLTQREWLLKRVAWYANELTQLRQALGALQEQWRMRASRALGNASLHARGTPEFDLYMAVVDDYTTCARDLDARLAREEKA